MSAGPVPGALRRVTVRAHAKINLDLRVGGRRPDGFHDVQTILQSIALHDTLILRAAAGACRIRCAAPGVPPGEDNLVHRAARSLWTELGGRGDVRGVAVTIRKRIPVAAGLGGGTADAVAALRGLCLLWGRSLPAARLQALAADVGADGPFFLVGGTVLGTGRGDDVYPLAELPPHWAVLAVPPQRVSTADAYGWLDDDRASAARGRPTAAAASPPAPFAGASPLPPFAGETLVFDGLRNDLEGPVAWRRAGIGEAAARLVAAGARRAAMSGSGPAVFGLFERRSAAFAAARELRTGRDGWTVRVTRTMDRARLGPRFRVRGRGGVEAGAVDAGRP